MAFPSVQTSAITNTRVATIVAAYVADTTSSKFQTLGDIQGGEIHFKGNATNNSVKQNRFIGSFDFTAKLTMNQASTVELKLLDEICNGTNSFLFKLSDAGAIPANSTSGVEGWLEVQAGQANCKAKVTADGDSKSFVKIELEWLGALQAASLDGALKADIAEGIMASTTDSATAVYFGIGVYTAAKDGGKANITHIKSAGIANVVLADAAGSGSSQTLSLIGNPKISLEMMATQDTIPRYIPTSLAVTIEYEWLHTDAADLLILDTLSTFRINVTINMLNGTTITLTDQVGIETDFQSVGDMSDKLRAILITHKGSVLQASIDSIIS